MNNEIANNKKSFSTKWSLHSNYETKEIKIEETGQLLLDEKNYEKYIFEDDDNIITPLIYYIQIKKKKF